MTRGDSTKPTKQPVRMKAGGNFSAKPKAATAAEATVSSNKHQAPNDITETKGLASTSNARWGLPRSSSKHKAPKANKGGAAKKPPERFSRMSAEASVARAAS